MAQATTSSAVRKSSVYQTASPVLVPVPFDFANDATMPPWLVTALIWAWPNWLVASFELPPVSYQKSTREPCWLALGVPAQIWTGSPANVCVPVAIVGHVPVTFGRNCADGLSPPSSDAAAVASDGPAVASMSFLPPLELEPEPELDDDVPLLLLPRPPRSFEPPLAPLLFDELDDPPRLDDPLPLELPPPGSFPDGEDGVPPQQRAQVRLETPRIVVHRMTQIEARIRAPSTRNDNHFNNIGPAQVCIKTGHAKNGADAILRLQETLEIETSRPTVKWHTSTRSRARSRTQRRASAPHRSRDAGDDTHGHR